MIIYGRNAVSEALRSGQPTRVFIARGVADATVREFRKLARAAGVPVELVPRIELDQALRTTSHQGVAAEMPELAFSDEDAPRALARERGERLLLVLLDQIQDPHNYGAIIRSAEVLGAHGVITEERRSAPLSPTVAKTSAGAASHLPLVQVKNLPRFMDQLKQENVWLYAADATDGVAPDRLDWERDAGIVIGSEGSGLRRLVREKCDAFLTIPTRGKVASLNASVAAGIILHAAVTGRSHAG
jgi:23S rRNA (guanosine2251-2'-O)-methyltransferase